MRGWQWLREKKVLEGADSRTTPIGSPSYRRGRSISNADYTISVIYGAAGYQRTTRTPHSCHYMLMKTSRGPGSGPPRGRHFGIVAEIGPARAPPGLRPYLIYYLTVRGCSPISFFLLLLLLLLLLAARCVLADPTVFEVNPGTIHENRHPIQTSMELNSRDLDYFLGRKDHNKPLGACSVIIR